MQTYQRTISMDIFLTISAMHLDWITSIYLISPLKAIFGKYLQIFSTTFVNLLGKLPSFENCNSLYKLELWGNRISSSITQNIAKCQNILYIELIQNELIGVSTLSPPCFCTKHQLGVWTIITLLFSCFNMYQKFPGINQQQN